MGESTCVSCPRDSYVLAKGVRLRPVPEMGACLAYTPAHPRLHRLDTASWLIASLCDGSPREAMWNSYRQAMHAAGATEPSATAFAAGVERLLELGIIQSARPEGGVQ